MADGDPERKDYRKESRKNYGQDGKVGEGLCIDQIRLGAELRSADAMEKIAVIMSDIHSYLSSIRWSLDGMNRMPTKTKREITRLKNIIKKQKAEIADLKTGGP